MLLYKGPSAINGEPIVCIATGTHNPSKNKKTGAMVQIWILHAKYFPTIAVKKGEDEAICGDCKHRNKSCYVNVFQAPTNIWRSYIKGLYKKTKVPQAVKNRFVRIGAYGDMAALPEEINNKLVQYSKGHTAYTHQWKLPEAQYLKEIAVASVDSINEYRQAKKLGWQTFRIYKDSDQLITEQRCIAQIIENTQCLDCLKCNGNNQDICAKIHGAKYKINSFTEPLIQSYNKLHESN